MDGPLSYTSSNERDGDDIVEYSGEGLSDASDPNQGRRRSAPCSVEPMDGVGRCHRHDDAPRRPSGRLLPSATKRDIRDEGCLDHAEADRR